MKRVMSAVIAGLLAAGLVFAAFRIDDPMYTGSDGGGDEGTLIMWYTDDSLTEFLNDAAVSYRDETGIRVRPELVDGVDFLRKINHASVYEGESENGEPLVAPDLYITTHDNLMKAYYAGLASEITDPARVINPINYPDTSLHAIRCAGKYVGYPLYYETNFLLYNKTYMVGIAKQHIEKEPEFSEEDIDAVQETPEDVGTEISSNGIVVSNQVSLSGDSISSDVLVLNDEDPGPMGEENAAKDPKVLEKLANMIPATIDDILTFANNYDAPEEVEAIFKWDVSDIFYNYFFVGNYMNVGGEDGDDNSYFNIYNQQAVDCLKVYQNINQFFSIDSKAVTYDSILSEFIEGKTVFTVATTDAIAKIRQAREKGEFEYDYGVAVLPDISSTLKARGLSETSTLVVNGYSDRREAANGFAQYLSYNKAADVYKKTGRISCLKNVTYEDEEIMNVMQEYEKSVPMPKMIEAGNYWVQLEIAFTKVWNGADPDETLRELNDTIGEQIDELEQHVLTQESIKVGID